MRDYRKLEVFALADSLAMDVYEATRHFPDGERYGLTSQLRRAAISVGTNIVEGSARHSDADFLRFLTIAYGSACELEYELSISMRLGYLGTHREELLDQSSRTCKALRALILKIRNSCKSS